MNEEKMSIEEVEKLLPDMQDDALVQMAKDIQADPTRFAEHVGYGPASSFLASLLLELHERGIQQIEGVPLKEKTNVEKLRTRDVTALGPQPKKALPRQGASSFHSKNRKQRRAEAAQARKLGGRA